VLAFFVVAWATLATTLALSQPVREANLRGLPGTGTVDVMVLLGGIAGFLTVLAVGVVNRWRWLFWMLLLAFTAGLIRVPVAFLQLRGLITPEGPDWYVVLQGGSGVVQGGLALALLAGYRRAGPWGAF